MVRRGIGCALVLAALLIADRPAFAQSDTTPDTQLWAEFTFTRIQSKRISYGIDLEPKVLIWAPPGDPGWATLDATTSFEYSRGAWLDMVNEFLVGRTRQTNDLDSTEVTPRIGLRLHLLSNLREDFGKERRSKYRLVLRDLARVEWRNLYYSTDKPTSSTVRFRDRVELFYPLNRPRLTDDGAVYALADGEWFWPLDEPDERYAYRQRYRAGIGYRRSFQWRFEGLFIVNRSRDTIDEKPTTTDYIAEFTMKRVW